MDVRRSILRRGIMFVEKESVWPCAGEKHDSLDKWFKYVVEEDTTFDVDHRFNLNRMSLFDVTVNGITNTIFLFSFFSLFKKKLKTLHVKPASFPRFFSFSLFLSFTLGVGLISPGVGTWMIVMETRVNSLFQNKSFRLYWLQKKKTFSFPWLPISRSTYTDAKFTRFHPIPYSHGIRESWNERKRFSFFFPIWKIFFLGRKVCVSRVMCPKSSLFWLSYKFSFYKNRSSCPITPISFSLSLSLHYF